MRRIPALLCLTVISLLSLPAVAAAACGPVMARPSIEVRAQILPIQFDLKRTIAELSKLDINTPAAQHDRYHTDVGGVMSGRVSVNHEMTFRSSIEETGGNGCVGLTGITVTLTVEPQIFIASDLRHKECLFKEVFGHEARHVEVDRALLEKYRGRFADGLKLILMTPADYQSAQLPEIALPGARQKIQEEIEYALGVLYTDMMQERQLLQRDIDSAGEYARISHTCQVSS